MVRRDAGEQPIAMVFSSFADLIDTLPGGPTIDELGRIQPGSLRTLLLPGVVVALAALVLFVFLR